MGKVVEKVKLSSLFDPAKTLEVLATIDTGSTMMVLPQDIVDELGLKKIREATVKYADTRTKTRSVYAPVMIEVKGRTGVFETIAEVVGADVLVGQVVLESLDLLVDTRNRTLTPNPKSPEMPMIEIL